MGLLDFVSEAMKAGIDLTIGVPVGVVKDVVTGGPITGGKSATVEALADTVDHLEQAADKLPK